MALRRTVYNNTGTSSFLLSIAAIFALLLAALVISYFLAGIFDKVMGTTARPIIMLSSLAGMTGTSSWKTYFAEKSASDDFKNTLKGAAAMLVMAPVLAFLATLFFSGTVDAFMGMVNYSGSFVGLSFWGTLFAAAIHVTYYFVRSLIVD